MSDADGAPDHPGADAARDHHGAGDGARSRVRGPRPGGPRSGRRGRGGERKMVPDAVFTSYYGRPVVKASPWEKDIPAYLFLGGVAAGSSLLAAGADLTGRPVLRQASRLAAAAAITVSFGALVHDLGRPSRFANMLRVAKPTSPMSVGTWILTVYGPMAGLAGAAELPALLPRVLSKQASKRVDASWVTNLVRTAARPAGFTAAALAPAIASYTAVLLADTATPSWHDAFRELPFVFVGSAAAASGGFGMTAAPLGEAGPARRLAIGGAVLELAAERLMEQTMGITAEPLHTGPAGRFMKASKALTAGGALLAATLGRRSRPAAFVAGSALMAGSACTRFGIFEAGQASAKDPKYTMVPQRDRLAARTAEGRRA